MFNYLLKNIPAKFVFAGYNVRKSLTVMTTNTENGVIYDVFLYTYVDNYLSFYILMDDGKYKCVDQKVNVDSIDAVDLISRHLFRGSYYDTTEFDSYDKEQVIGVFGLRGITDLLKQVDQMDNENDNHEMSLQALIDNKAQYNGMEIMGAINRFNRNLHWEKGLITVPAIKNSPDDTFASPIGDEFDFFDFMTDKSFLKCRYTKLNLFFAGRLGVHNCLIIRLIVHQLGCWQCC